MKTRLARRVQHNDTLQFRVDLEFHRLNAEPVNRAFEQEKRHFIWPRHSRSVQWARRLDTSMDPNAAEVPEAAPSAPRADAPVPEATVRFLYPRSRRVHVQSHFRAEIRVNRGRPRSDASPPSRSITRLPNIPIPSRTHPWMISPSLPSQSPRPRRLSRLPRPLRPPGRPPMMRRRPRRPRTHPPRRPRRTPRSTPRPPPSRTPPPRPRTSPRRRRPDVPRVNAVAGWIWFPRAIPAERPRALARGGC